MLIVLVNHTIVGSSCELHYSSTGSLPMNLKPKNNGQKLNSKNGKSHKTNNSLNLTWRTTTLTIPHRNLWVTQNLQIPRGGRSQTKEVLRNILFIITLPISSPLPATPKTSICNPAESFKTTLLSQSVQVSPPPPPSSQSVNLLQPPLSPYPLCPTPGDSWRMEIQCCSPQSRPNESKRNGR